MCELSVSVVTYAPVPLLLEKTLTSVRDATAHVKQQGLLGGVSLAVVDNGPGTTWRPVIEDLVAKSWGSDGKVLSAEGNVGYGQGHNLGARSSNAKYHLVLNPDVTLNEEALTHAVEYMEAYPRCGMLGPKGLWPSGERQYLVKRYPSVLDLAVRAWAPEWLKRRFSTRLDRYEMRNEAEDVPLHKVPIISGCFMFARREAFMEVGGFSDAFFLYFEDFDLSLRIGERWDVAYVPAVQIEHAGGQAGRKGLRHIALFVSSATKFFSIHGWKW